MTEESIAENFAAVSEFKEQLEEDRNTSASFSAPTQVADLKTKLDNFYQIEQQAVELVYQFYTYLDQTVTYWQKTERYSNQYNNLTFLK